MTAENDTETIERAMRLRWVMNESLRTMTPQERDRMMQIHLAQARGPAANAVLLRQGMNRMIRLRQTQAAERDGNG